MMVLRMEIIVITERVAAVFYRKCAQVVTLGIVRRHFNLFCVTYHVTYQLCCTVPALQLDC